MYKINITLPDALFAYHFSCQFRYQFRYQSWYQSRYQCRYLFVLVSILILGGCDSRRFDSAQYAQAQSIAAQPQHEWQHYLGDAAASHYSPLNEITPANVNTLEVAWRYDANQGEKLRGEIQCNPLIINGVLYGVSAGADVFALNAATGAEVWRVPALAASSSFLPNPVRGLAYWQPAPGAQEPARLLFSSGNFLFALNAVNGELIEAFGDQGRVDLREGLGERAAGKAAVVSNSPGVVFKNLIIMGTRVSEMSGAAPGDVRAYDTRSGELVWTFHTIPRPGEFGADTWPQDAWERVGGANSWAGITIDAERGLAFVPTGSPAFDYYGGDREGNNLFANSLVALDAASGKRVWHYQFVRHDLWDRDLPAPPNLITLRRDGKMIPAVAQVTKTGHTFVFHRATGEPLFPIEEVAVTGTPLPGEFPATSQPVPLLPPAFTTQGMNAATVTDRDAASTAYVKARLKKIQHGGLYDVPGPQATVVFPGTDGGAEWGGAAWDESSQLLYVNANNVPWVLEMVAVPKDYDMSADLGGGYLLACGGCHGAARDGDGFAVPPLRDISARMSVFDVYRIARDGRGRMPGMGGVVANWQLALLAAYVYWSDPDDSALLPVAQAGEDSQYLHAGYNKLTDLDGFPASKPPWGSLTAIDLAKGTLAWQIPLGDYAKTRAAGLSGFGAENYGGPVVTAGGVLFIAATPDERIRAFDKRSGELLWQQELSASAFATPAVYQAAGRQFLVVAAGGNKLQRPAGGEYIAFALPAKPKASPGVASARQ